MSDAIEFAMLKPSQLVPHKSNIRADLGDVSDLAASLKAQGVLEALNVTPNGKPGKFVILAGHRRHAAAKSAKLTEVPCIIRRDLTDEADQIAFMLSENVERADLTPVEEAKAVAALFDLGDNARQVATRTGMSLKRVQTRAKIAKLPDTVTAKLTAHAVTLDDAAFIATHSSHAGDLAALEAALGTNDWAATKQRVITSVVNRKAGDKLVAAVKRSGLTVIDDDWAARRAFRRDAAQRLGCRDTDLTDTSMLNLRVWPDRHQFLTSARETPENAFVFLTRFANATEAEVHVLSAPATAPSTDAKAETADGGDAAADEPSTDAGAADTEVEINDRSESEPDQSAHDEAQAAREQAQAEERATRRAHTESLEAAAAVRHDFIRTVIRSGDLAHARLAGQFAGQSEDYLEVCWWSLLPYLPLADRPDDDDNHEAATASVKAWFDTCQNPCSILLGLTWLWFEPLDRYLDHGRGSKYVGTDELPEMIRYIQLLEACGHTFSDVELELVADYRAAAAADSEEPGE